MAPINKRKWKPDTRSKAKNISPTIPSDQGSKSKKRSRPQQSPKDQAPKLQKTESKDVPEIIKDENAKEEPNTGKELKDSMFAINLTSESDNKGHGQEKIGKLATKGETNETLEMAPFPGFKDLGRDSELSQCRKDLCAQDLPVATLKAEIERLNLDHGAEIGRLQREKNAAERMARNLQEEMENMEAKYDDAEVAHKRKESEHSGEKKKLKADLKVVEKERDGLQYKLAAEQKKTVKLKGAEKEGDKLRKKLEAEQEKNTKLQADLNWSDQDCKGHLQKLTAVEERVKSLQIENKSLKPNLEEEKSAHSTTQTELNKKISALETELSHAKEALDSLEVFKVAHADLSAQLDKLRIELSTVQAAASSVTGLKMRIFELEEKHSTRSSSPSLSFENSGQSRIENVKKTYITIKMRYDNLYKIGKDISTVTRGLQFSAFGELGALLRRLKGAIEEADIAAESDVVSQGGNDGAGG